MSGALDAFRAQQEAADRVHARLTEVARLLERLQAQADALARDADLRTALSGRAGPPPRRRGSSSRTFGIFENRSSCSIGPASGADGRWPCCLPLPRWRRSEPRSATSPQLARILQMM